MSRFTELKRQVNALDRIVRGPYYRFADNGEGIRGRTEDLEKKVDALLEHFGLEMVDQPCQKLVEKEKE